MYFGRKFMHLFARFLVIILFDDDTINYCLSILLLIKFYTRAKSEGTHDDYVYTT